MRAAGPLAALYWQTYTSNLDEVQALHTVEIEFELVSINK
jgi:hypothetical protein